MGWVETIDAFGREKLVRYNRRESDRDWIDGEDCDRARSPWSAARGRQVSVVVWISDEGRC